jgi:hypothetical protein
MSYKLKPNGVQRLMDGSSIPADGSNRDWQEYLAWLAEGNTPLSADPPPTPIDLSDVDNLEKAIKALALCIAQVGGLTVPQIKQMFKQKWDALP